MASSHSWVDNRILITLEPSDGFSAKVRLLKWQKTTAVAFFPTATGWTKRIPKDSGVPEPETSGTISYSNSTGNSKVVFIEPAHLVSNHWIRFETNDVKAKYCIYNDTPGAYIIQKRGAPGSSPTDIISIILKLL